ncbi:MAG: DnaJ domain-containing protein [Patescibacteria group bacterium]|nr:DnaJ domain-containing protein [Patescibacteria group bacterium]
MKDTSGFKDYYKILNISKTERGSSGFDGILRTKFRQAAKKYHPDVSELPTKKAEEKFREANEAYVCLMGKKLKERYDVIWRQNTKERRVDNKPGFKPSDEVNRKYKGFKEDPYFSQVMKEWDAETKRMTEEWDAETKRMTEEWDAETKREKKEWDDLPDVLGGSEFKG